MFFNVSREKSGRPGRSGDVMDAVDLSPPTRPRNRLHTEKLARTVQQDNVQARGFELSETRTINKTTTEGARDRRFT